MILRSVHTRVFHGAARSVRGDLHTKRSVRGHALWRSMQTRSSYKAIINRPSLNVATSSAVLLGASVALVCSEADCEYEPANMNFAAASAMSGVWVQDKKRCESLGPFLSGLGIPSFVAPFVDGISTTLRFVFISTIVGHFAN